MTYRQYISQMSLYLLIIIIELLLMDKLCFCFVCVQEHTSQSCTTMKTVGACRQWGRGMAWCAGPWPSQRQRREAMRSAQSRLYLLTVGTTNMKNISLPLGSDLHGWPHWILCLNSWCCDVTWPDSHAPRGFIVHCSATTCLFVKRVASRKIHAVLNVSIEQLTIRFTYF